MQTVVHLIRHGEVENPEGILYGRLPGYHLSKLGHDMADRLSEYFSGRLDSPKHDVRVVTASPLVRAQETANPIAQKLDLPVGTDPRLIESGNHFEGLTFGVGDGSLRHVRHWPYLRNPFKPSWGEPFANQAERMRAAIDDARDQARGHEAVLISHQSPVWIVRRSLEGKHLWHDPRRRECSLASVTSLIYDDDTLVRIDYVEPAADLLPGASKAVGA